METKQEVNVKESIVNSQVSSSHLLVNQQTSETSDEIIKQFEEFRLKHGVDCQGVISRLLHQGQYITNGSYYFPFNTKLSFLQKFRARPNDLRKLKDFYSSFDMNKSKFWTITKKTSTFSRVHLDNEDELRKPKLRFDDLDELENNLKAFIKRLDRYGVHMSKAIIVLEIKERAWMFNAHYHLLIEFSIDLDKIRSNKRPEFRELVFDKNRQEDRLDGWVSNPLLSEIWKEITQDGSYRIYPEPIRSRVGALHYTLSYINKGIQYDHIAAIPILYYALKSKKSYRLKGCGKMPKIETRLYDIKKDRIKFQFNQVRWVDREKIPVDSQEYYLEVLKNGKVIESSHKKDYFNNNVRQEFEGNEILSNFIEKIRRNRLTFEKKHNWEEVEKIFNQQELTKLIECGEIYETKEGYKIL